MMKKKGIFCIPFVGLKVGNVYEYDFDIKESLFEEGFWKKLGVEIVKLNVELKVLKNNQFLDLMFQVYGDILGDCDRCTSRIKIKVLEEYKLIYKMVSEPEVFNASEGDPDIRYIGFNDAEINVEDVVKEFVVLSIPEIKKCLDDGEGEFCNKEILKRFL